MDLYKIDDHYVLTADLPVWIQGRWTSPWTTAPSLTAHRSARSGDSVQWLANERFFGTYRRQLSLGESGCNQDRRNLRERRADGDDPVS